MDITRGLHLILLVCLWLSIPALAHAQGELRRMAISRVTPPTAGIPVFTDHPDKAAIIISSSLTNLVFTSNMEGIVDQRSEPDQGRYILIVEPFTQIIQVNAPGFISGRFRVAAPQSRDVLYYEINPEQVTPDLIPVFFSVQPADANVFVDNQIVEANRTIQLQPGPKSIRVERTGFRIIEDVIVVSLDNIMFSYNLERVNPQPVQIRSTPPGAQVTFDDADVGQTDRNGVLEIFRFPGDYQLTVSSSGYLSEQRGVEVREDAVNEFVFELVQNVGWLSLSVDPSDAVVMLNRRSYDASGLLELPPGLYRLEVSKNGFEGFVDDIQIQTGQESRIRVNLDRITGTLLFSVSPSTAQAILTDSRGTEVQRWSGLRQFSDLAAGEYVLTVRNEGYQEHTETVRISGNERVEKHISLSEIPQMVQETPGVADQQREAVAQGRTQAAGRLRAAADLANTEIWVDGEMAGRGFTNQILPAGNYSVEFRHASGTRTRKVSIRPDAMEDLYVQFRPSRMRAMALGTLVPGGGHVYTGRSRGYLYGAVFVGSVAGSYVFYRQHQDISSDYDQALNDFQVAQSNYQQADSYSSAVLYREQMFSLQQRTKRLHDDRIETLNYSHYLIYAAVAIYTVNLIDLLATRPQYGYRSRTPPAGFSVGLVPMHHDIPYAQLTWRRTF